MSMHAITPPVRKQSGQEPEQTLEHKRQAGKARSFGAPLPFRFAALTHHEESTYRQAELFYLQKQIQGQTPMVIVLEDGEKVEGCIEWYDRNCLKVRGRVKTLVYKSAIKYMYKVGENG